MSEPTLREGMESADGWVEYLQSLLFYALYDCGDDPAGRFGPGTEAAVKQFQHDHHLRQDGVVGDQTWSVLRKNPEQAAVGDSGDGRDHVERGVELRFGTDHAFHPDGWTGAGTSATPALVIDAFSVGDTPPPLDQTTVVSHVRHPDGGSSEAPGWLVHVADHAYLAVVHLDTSAGAGRYSVLSQLQVTGHAAGNDTYQCEIDVEAPR